MAKKINSFLFVMTCLNVSETRG